MEVATYNQGCPFMLSFRLWYRIGASARERGLQPMKPKYAEVRAKVPWSEARGHLNPFFGLRALHNHDGVELLDAFNCQMRSIANTPAGISAGIAPHSD